MNLITLVLLFSSVTIKFDLPKGLISGLCFVESSHIIHALNIDDGKSPSLGVCQIKYQTAKLMGYKGSQTELMNPSNNVYFAAKYLKYQITRYKGDIRKAVAAYNAGSYKKSTVYINSAVNHKYVEKVFLAWAENK